VIAGVERVGAYAVCRGSASEVGVAPDSENRIDSLRNIGAEDGALKARIMRHQSSVARSLLKLSPVNSQ